MDTETYLIIKEPMDDITKLDGTALMDCEQYIELIRHTKEIHHLFCLFHTNLGILHEKYTLLNSGAVKRNENNTIEYDDYIAINTLVTNIIESGKTLIESSDCFFRKSDVIPVEIKDRWKSFCSKIYDESFSYRFLYKLRDFSVHGHLPISSNGQIYYFDVNQILRKPHFTHNKKIRCDLEKLKDEAFRNYANTPDLGLTTTLAEYVYCLLSIYCAFWDYCYDSLETYIKRINSVVSEYKNNIREGLFIFRDHKNDLHAVFLEEDPLLVYESIIKEAKTVQKKYKKEWKSLADNMLVIKCDPQQIEISHGIDYIEL